MLMPMLMMLLTVALGFLWGQQMCTVVQLSNAVVAHLQRNLVCNTTYRGPKLSVVCLLCFFSQTH